MNAVKSQALEVLNLELATPHGPGVDMIHNMLSDMDDNELFEGIIKPGKSLSNSLQFAASKAKEYASNGIACVPDEFVLNAVIEYFKSDKKNVQVVASVSASNSSKPIETKREVKQEPLVMESVQQAMDLIKASKSKTKKHNNENEEAMMSIFDFIEAVEPELEEYEDDDERDEEYSD